MFRTASQGEGRSELAVGSRCYPHGARRSPHHDSQLVRPALNVFGFGTFFAGNDVKRHLISFVQGLKTLAYAMEVW